MARIILLDAGVIGLLISPIHLDAVAEGLDWLDLLVGRAKVMMSDLTAYEVRRELIRLGSSRKLGRLDDLRSNLARAEMTEAAWIKASEFWATVRQAGKPTASPDALDADAILAGVAATIGTAQDVVTIATTNVRHLSWFAGIDAQDWRAIAP